MKIFSTLASKQKKATKPKQGPDSAPESNRHTVVTSTTSSKRAEVCDSKSDGQLSSTARSTYVATVKIPNAQAFVASDAPFNAGASNYVQSTMMKKQRTDANKAEAIHQAAMSQTKMKEQMQATSTKPTDGWPSLPVYLDVPGPDINNPAYVAMLSHLGMTQAHMTILEEDFGKSLHAMVKPHKAEKKHVMKAGQEACEIMNRYLSEKWSVSWSVSYVWDASIDAGAFRFFYPQSKADRLKWCEQVKGPYFTPEDWDEWNENKRRLGVA